MPQRPVIHRLRPSRSKVERDREADERRGSSRSRGYDGSWEKARAAHLAAEPLCRYCEIRFGRVEPATLVDHLYPHRGDRALFWLRLYWVSTCKSCHDGWKQALEAQGRAALDPLAHRLGKPPLGQGGSQS